MTVCAGPRDAADNPPSCCASSGVSELVNRDKNTQEGFFAQPSSPTQCPPAPQRPLLRQGNQGKRHGTHLSLGPISILYFNSFFF